MNHEPRPDLKPQPGPQSEFCAAQEDEVLFGGAAFCAKTYGLMLNSLHQIAHPQCQILTFRREYGELGEMINYAWQMFPRLGAVCSNEGKDWRFPSGARHYFRHMEHRDDWRKYQGGNWTEINYDELCNFEAEQYFTMFAWNRAAASGLRCYVRATTNPWGIGLDWVKARFVEAGPWNTTLSESFTLPNGSVVTRSRRFIPARYTDNPIGLTNNPQYVASLMAIPDPAKRQALLDGNWDVSPGQFFSRFWRQTHVLSEQAIQARLEGQLVRRIRALDWGGNAPLCCLWLARTADGTCYVYREHYQADRPAQWHVPLIRERTPTDERIGLTVADPSMWSRKSKFVTYTDKALADEFAELGLPLVRANNDQLLGYAALLDLIYTDETRPPRFFVAETCPHLIADLVQAQRDAENPDKVQDDEHRHALVTARYGVMHLYQPRPSVQHTTADPWTTRGTLARLTAGRQAAHQPRWAQG